MTLQKNLVNVFVGPGRISELSPIHAGLNRSRKLMRYNTVKQTLTLVASILLVTLATQFAQAQSTPPTEQASLQSCEEANQMRQRACQTDRDNCLAQVPHTPAACVRILRLCMSGSAREFEKWNSRGTTPPPILSPILDFALNSFPR